MSCWDEVVIIRWDTAAADRADAAADRADKAADKADAAANRSGTAADRAGKAADKGDAAANRAGKAADKADAAADKADAAADKADAAADRADKAAWTIGILLLIFLIILIVRLVLRPTKAKAAEAAAAAVSVAVVAVAAVARSWAESQKRYRALRIAAWTIGIILLIFLIILIVWLVLRPTKPRFSLEDATVSQFNLTCPTSLCSTFQVAISFRNPNDRVGIYYDKLDAYAEYEGQQMTLPTAIPRAYQSNNDGDVWSPYLRGDNMPIAPYLAEELCQGEGAVLLLKIKVEGSLRWKVGPWISGRYPISVVCPAFLTITPSPRFQLGTCSVDM